MTLTTQTEDIAFLKGWYLQIYGQSIDITSSSQDGQMLNIYTQVLQDVKTMILATYTSRDINQAVGTQLDILVTWTQRQGGTFTQYNLAVTVNGATTLYGLDQATQPVFTYQDAAGNQYELVITQTPGSAGTFTYLFQAAQPGNVTSAINSINVPVTNVTQVTAVNNPNPPVIQGVDEETDFIFRQRALASTAIASQGFYDALFATLGNAQGAAKIQLYENYLDTTSPNAATPVAGIPPHCIWAIVQGSATPSAIAQAIYAQKTLGCNMKGSQTFAVTRPDGSTITIQWDNVVVENVFIQFTATSIDGIHPPNIAAIIAGLPALLDPAPGATLNINQVQAAVQQIDPNTLVTGAGLATASGGPYTNTLAPAAANFQLVVTSAKIFITPMLLLPQTATVAHGSPGGTVQFIGYGGTQTGYTYSFVTNASGGTINSGSGLYTAGNTGNVTDTVKVQDSNGNTATATITVT
jgi:hypothetical protein